jgi:hypothetical protein
MNTNESPPQKEKEPGASNATAQSEDSCPTYTSHLVRMQGRPCKDIWIENYLGYIERLNCQSGCEPSPTRALAIAVRRYSTFCCTCCPSHRKHTWRAVHRAVAFFRHRN